MKNIFAMLLLVWPALAGTTATVDLSKYDAGGAVLVSQPDPGTLQAAWSDRQGARYRARFNLAPDQPLLQTLETAPGANAPFAVVGRNLDVRYRVTLGTRHPQIGWPYIFFDKVGENTPAPVAHLSTLQRRVVQVRSESKQRLSIGFSDLGLGPFTGELTFYIYDGSPFLQVQASMPVNRPWVAYIYDALLYGDFATVDYRDTQGAMQSKPASALAESAPGEPAGVKAKHRTIMGTLAGGTGTVAMVAPPHAGLYPLDRSDNYGFLQAGKTFIGTKMSYWGDRGYVPWVDAPEGATQRLDAFLFFSAAAPQPMLERALAYTHGDVFKPVPGHYTMAEHFHPEFTQAFLNGKDSLTPFKQAMKAVGVQIVQPMEFHLGKGRMHPVGEPDKRLAELHAMYTLLATNSDETFVLIPGEEYNEFFGGHWSYLFPRPVYFTGWRGKGDRAYRLTNVVSGGVTYPLVYQIGDAEQMHQLLKDEGGVAWSSHPRIKDTQRAPDNLVHTDFYRDAAFLAGDWKAMPADLSKDRLGFRAFQLMDDTAQWGYRKAMLGEVDTFDLDPTHEIYGNLNVNYLQLSKLPSGTNWSEVVDCVREGRFFTTTGELLIHSWTATATGVSASVEWYFPPAFAEMIWGDDAGVHRQKLPLSDRVEFGRQPLSIAADLSGANWVRFEVWDVARNGAFTQPHWLKPPANPKVVPGTVTSFTLINADTDAPVPGYDPIPSEAVLERAKLPANLTIRANLSPMIVDRVTLELDGRSEARSRWPYCLDECAVNKGLRGCPFYDYAPSTLSAGRHTLRATPFRGDARGNPLTLSFTVAGDK